VSGEGKRHVRVVAPAGPVSIEALEAGLTWLRRQDCEVVEAVHLRGTWGHLAGRDADRAADLMEAFLDPRADLVWAARGGFGCARLLRLLDWERLAEVSDPPLLVGYSDLTSLQCALWTRLGWPCLHGPMSATELGGGIDGATLDSLLPFVTHGPAPECAQCITLSKEQLLAPGLAEGPLLGGNLSVLSSMLGSPWFPDCRGVVLFLEDYGEFPFRVDRHLAQLMNAGVLSEVSAILLGHFPECLEPDPEKSTFSVDELFEQYFAPLGIPVIRGLPFGHAAPRISLPVGGLAVVNTEALRVELLPRSWADLGVRCENI